MSPRRFIDLRAWPFVAAMLTSQAAFAQFEDRTSGTKARLRGVSVVDRDVAWASGAEGTVLRTLDGGRTWIKRAPAGTSSLDFRDVHALDARLAWILSIGEGDKSRIYATEDGGETWTPRYVGRRPEVFLDAVAFWDARRGLAFGDPIEGRHLVLTTDDGGATWEPVKPDALPSALAGEGAFAASGTCLVALGDGYAWFATGGAAKARVFRSTDRGRTWTAHETPVKAGNASSGIFSLAFRDERNGVAVGGDYKSPDASDRVAAVTTDGGKTWTLADRGPGGYRSAVVALPKNGYLAVGPSGGDVSTDGGKTWSPIPNAGFHALGRASDGTILGVGESGRIGKWIGGSEHGR